MQSVRTIWKYQGYFKPHAYVYQDLGYQISYWITNGSKNLCLVLDWNIKDILQM